MTKAQQEIRTVQHGFKNEQILTDYNSPED
jgi:hypothetical protein